MSLKVKYIMEILQWLKVALSQMRILQIYAKELSGFDEEHIADVIDLKSYTFRVYL